MRYLPATLFLLCPVAALSAQDCEPGKFLPADGVGGDLFGCDVSISGSLALIGAYRADLPGAPSAGSVYLYRRDLLGWSELRRVDHPSPSPGAYFGEHVSLDRDHAVIGAPGENAVGIDSGAAYVLTLPQFDVDPLVPSYLAHGDLFGDAVDIAGEVAVVGAHGADLVNNYAGAAFVFERDPASGAWVETAVLTAPEATSNDRFGRSVAIDGGRIAVGAVDANSDVGAVYLFERAAGAWTFVEKVVPGGGNANDEFGREIVLRDDLMFVAATQRWSGNGHGMVYGFEEGATGWVHQHTLVPPSGQAAGMFGVRMDLAGGVLVIGDRSEGGLGFESGAVSVFREQGGTWVPDGWARAPAPENSDNFGSGVAATNDGHLLAGAQGDDEAGAESGAAFAYSALPPALFQHLCFCPAGPCNNDALDAGCLNAQQRGARLLACGSPSVTQDALVLQVLGARSDQLGLVFMGGATQSPVQLGNGLMCIAAPHYRFDAKQADTAGSLTEGPGLVAYAAANFHPQGHITVGSTWYFQAWYRDPGGLCGWPYATSNALAVTFTN